MPHRLVLLVAALAAFAAATPAAAQVSPPEAELELLTTSRTVALRQQEIALRVSADRPARVVLELVLRIRGRTALAQQVRVELLAPGVPQTKPVPLSARVRKKIKRARRAPRVRISGTVRDAAGGEARLKLDGKLG